MFSKEAVIPICSCPEDAFDDLTANLISGAKLLSIAFKIAFRILSSTVLTKISVSLSFLPLKYPFKFWTLTVFSPAVQI